MHCGLHLRALHAVRGSRLAIRAATLNDAPRTPDRVGWKSCWVSVWMLRLGREVDPLSPTPVRWDLACALIAVDADEECGANVKYHCASVCIRPRWQSLTCAFKISLILKRTSIDGFASSQFGVPDNLGFYDRVVSVFKSRVLDGGGPKTTGTQTDCVVEPVRDSPFFIGLSFSAFANTGIRSCTYVTVLLPHRRLMCTRPRGACHIR